MKAMTTINIYNNNDYVIDNDDDNYNCNNTTMMITRVEQRVGRAGAHRREKNSKVTGAMEQ